MSWDSSVPGVSPGGDILGYQLIIRDPSTATKWIAFDGQAFGVPQQTQYTVYGLNTGKSYDFSVLAINFNGKGSESNRFTYYSCVPPA